MQIRNETSSLAREAARVEQAFAKRTEEHICRRYVWSSEGHQFVNQERERQTLALLRQYGCMPLTERTILEVGCGSGAWIQQFIRWGANPGHVTGIDLRADVLARGRANLPAAVRLEQANAAALPLAPGQFDIVLQSTMFTSVLDPQLRRQIAAEMLRVLKPNGVILWYDFLVNNPANPDVRGVCKQEISRLFTGCKFDLRRVTLVPPVLRWLAPRSWFLTYMLSHVRPFCTHYLGVITPLSSRA
jgi:ubiquinone/menaquinone biosynthesis C-methylase UbiE